MPIELRNYLVVTGGYWAFTLTDGAIRMMVVLYFHQLGYSPFEVAMLFVFYEFFGIVTNLVGGWLAARLGLNVTMHVGMALQVVALGMLAAPAAWLSVPYVMFAQALSGIAKDLNKMSAKASIKTLVPANANDRLFKWVAILTGSKNALKGLGFFLGALLLQLVGFQMALAMLAASLFVVLITTYILLPNDLGRSKNKPAFSQVFSNNAAINWLSAARFFLFGARDVWFVVAVPVFMYSVLGWSFTQVGTFMALWVIGYGLVQGLAPAALRLKNNPSAGPRAARFWVFLLALVTLAITATLYYNTHPAWTSWLLVTGLLVFGVIFAFNSSLHSWLILAYADYDKVALKVGFYYMANSGGRLVGTLLSGAVYQVYGLIGCLLCSAAFALIAFLLSLVLPALPDNNSQ